MILFFMEVPNPPDRIYAANFEGCSQIDIRNVSLINASYWTLRISDCDHVQIRGITIRSTSYLIMMDRSRWAKYYRIRLYNRLY